MQRYGLRLWIALQYEKNPKSQKDLYFTHDHEWVDFQGSVVYGGCLNAETLPLNPGFL